MSLCLASRFLDYCLQSKLLVMCVIMGLHFFSDCVLRRSQAPAPLLSYTVPPAFLLTNNAPGSHVDVLSNAARQGTHTVLYCTHVTDGKIRDGKGGATWAMFLPKSSPGANRFRTASLLVACSSASDPE